jgi:hypothetical protein
MRAEEVMRYIVPRPGLKGWAHGERGHPLPQGLPHQTPVEILERSGWSDLIVKAGDGGIWQVRAAAIDCGTEYRTRSGRWIPESDDRARRFILKLRTAIHENDRSKIYVHDTNEQLRRIADLEWRLERNGWKAPPLGPE